MRKPDFYKLFKRTGKVADRKSKSSTGVQIIKYSILFMVLVTAVSYLNPDAPSTAAYIMGFVGILTGLYKMYRS